MELRHLRYFVAAIEEGSLTIAAERRRHTSQPSLSRQIRDLEHEVGVELLSRSVHGVDLTVAGKAFLDHARLALMQVDAAVEAARGAAQPKRKRLAIGFQTGHEMNWLPRAMHVRDVRTRRFNRRRGEGQPLSVRVAAAGCCVDHREGREGRSDGGEAEEQPSAAGSRGGPRADPDAHVLPA